MTASLLPRLVIAGMSGDSGKTLVSLALLLGVRDRGWLVRAFKKGPDYIDAAWLTWASGSPARHLDTFLVGADGVTQAFARHAVRAAGQTIGAVNVIEGNRGLFDGMDAEGTHSTAVLAKLLKAPVVLVLNVRKMTGTAAALVRGCQALDPDLRVAGVILNQVAGRRHETVAREAIERTCGVPVVGAVPRLDEPDVLPGRHLGLVTPLEHSSIDRVAGVLRRVAREHLDLDRILQISTASRADDEVVPPVEHADDPAVPSRPITIGYLSDSAFSFYYPENLEALEAQGATLVPLSSLADGPLPSDLAALYIGGGFPETHAATLEANRPLLDSLRAAAARGLPIYAECGGLILLARTVTWQGRRHTMAGVDAAVADVLAALPSTSPRPRGAAATPRATSGKVYLVGAGPGDPELLTVKGRRLLECADTVVYDALVDPRLFDLCPSSAALLYVGKRSGCHSRSQDEINALLVAEARAGHTVVRLKGGDPFMFGRGGEDAEALVEAGIAYEVVPGVSAGIAVPAYAGIPLTHRGVTGEVVFLTGHESETTQSPVDWTHYAQSSASLVIFMGLDNLGAIARRLLDLGRDPHCPVAVIENGTTDTQRTIVAPLATITGEAAAAGLQPPALIVVGEVVALRDTLQWFEHMRESGPAVN